MASEWEEVSIADIASRIAIGPFGSDIKTDNFVPTGVPVIRGGNLTSGRFNSNDFVFLTEEKADQLLNANAYPGDLVFTHRGTLGQVGLVPHGSYKRYVVSQSQMKLTCNPAAADPSFIYYFFKSPTGRHALLMHTSQTGVPAISRPVTSLKSVRIRLPTLPEQRAIAQILGTLDDKIELNRRMNETLDAIARALFKSWFVDFEPVAAKAEGRSPGWPARLVKIFPDSFQTSELGRIPTGWRVASIGDLCRRVAMGPFGSDIKTDNFIESGVPVIRGGNITNGFIDENFVFVSETKADALRNANAFPGDIVITHRGTLGQVGLIPRLARFPRYIVSQSQMLLSVNPELTTSRYIFEYLRSPVGQHALLANTSQTGVPAIARPTNSVRSIRILQPPLPLLASFDAIIGPLMARGDRASLELRSLSSLRDTLLPKLISGEVRVMGM